MFQERIRHAAGTWLILLLLAVWPANLQMLLDACAAGEPPWWTTLLLIRLPLQIPLIVLVWRASRRCVAPDRVAYLTFALARTITPMNRVMSWLVREWPYAGFLAGILLLALVPLWVSGMGLALALVYVQLPVYMLHQLEEHAGDRFRRFVNDRIGGGREVLTPQATLWINVLGVWVVDLIVLYLAVFVRLGFGLIAVYLAVVNAVVHAAAALALRGYNPGLWTGLLLFLPLGTFSLYEITASGARVWAHVLGILVAVAIHAAIVVHVRRRLAAMTR